MSGAHETNIKLVLEQIDQIKAQLDGMKALLLLSLEEGSQGKEMTVYDVRMYAVLEEVYRRGSIVTARELSEISTKWGKDPRGSAGYFSGNSPSMRGGLAGDKRALTPTGEKWVLDYREKYGDDWLDKVDVQYVGNPSVNGDAKIFIK